MLPSSFKEPLAPIVLSASVRCVTLCWIVFRCATLCRSASSRSASPLALPLLSAQCACRALRACHLPRLSARPDGPAAATLPRTSPSHHPIFRSPHLLSTGLYPLIHPGSHLVRLIRHPYIRNGCALLMLWSAADCVLPSRARSCERRRTQCNRRSRATPVRRAEGIVQLFRCCTPEGVYDVQPRSAIDRTLGRLPRRTAQSRSSPVALVVDEGAGCIAGTLGALRLCIPLRLRK